MKLQHIACAIALATGGLFFTHVVSEAMAATETKVVQGAIQPTQEQALVARQMATLVDRQHYLPMRLDANTSVRIFDMYIDSLDPDHSLFLQSEIDQFKQKYAAGFGLALKTGNLQPAYEIHAIYRARIQEYYHYMLAELKKTQNLHQKNVYLDTDREKAPFFKTKQEQKDFWNKVLTSQLIGLTITKEEEAAKQQALKDNPELAQGENLTPPEDLTPVQTLEKRYKRQLERVSRVKSDDVLEKTLNAMLATYDPHSNYYPPIDAMELNRQTTLQLEGIGVTIRPERGNEDYTKIETIVDGGPASKTGQVRSGDRIVGVAQDGQAMKDVVGWSSQEIVGEIRGKRGTKVTLKLVASGAPMSQARLVTITRDVIQEEDSGLRYRVVDVTHQGKKQKIGVIEIPSFYLNYRARRDGQNYRSVSEDTAKALIDLSKQNVAGVIVDLRNNPGGSLEEVAKMIGQVVKDGPVVQIRDGNGNVSVFEDTDGGQQLYAGPMAVMINLASASASEIYSAAIQDYGRGIIIGSTTTGKGTAQVQLDSLAYGQATLTQRKFYRITGGSTQNKGVIPDVKLIDIYFDQFGERKSKNPLEWDTIATAPFKREGVIKPYVNQLQQQSDQRRSQNPQFIYLDEYVGIARKAADEKKVVLDIDQRKAEINALEAQTLAVENARRKATNLAPYANWESYQAALDARSEARAKMKEAKRPPLPEEEAFVTESAQILLDTIDLQKAN
ncbi:carboxy terminal-processing peptidase [Acinetobacter puyangensis]|uniref:C-terminal processing peptidase-1. Serine peptidase. MEROPS family S41A n=1 Tax=Acinetobacter puyangensis TaxID=1096779 RepID=A0A240E3I3_9GAMM|nr:carboxy terminal-processing peptidase [Acinetobacter puyangensis]SNX43334.1 C-terminal processing peptidase-1. Serine peptidase. MEROPS family S41A [Acinetobacter puyangensis]